MRPSSGPKALPVIVEEKDIRKFYPYIRTILKVLKKIFIARK